MILLNYVLNVILIFFMYFLNTLVKILKMIVKIQQRFLWGGVIEGSKIAWVRWSNMYMSEKLGTLHVRYSGG